MIFPSALDIRHSDIDSNKIQDCDVLKRLDYSPAAEFAGWMSTLSLEGPFSSLESTYFGDLDLSISSNLIRFDDSEEIDDES